MLIETEPEYQLRLGTARSVYPGVFTFETNILEGVDVASFLETVKKQQFSMDPGDVETNSRHDYDGLEGFDELVNGVLAEFRSYGLVTEDNEQEVARHAQVMVSQGSTPHADAHLADWEWSMFWAFVLEDTDTDLLFGNLGVRVPLTAGQLILFDPGQPHGVVARSSEEFSEGDFPSSRKQYYLAGNIEYRRRFWLSLGVTTTAQHLTENVFADMRQHHVNTASRVSFCPFCVIPGAPLRARQLSASTLSAA